MGRQGYGLSRGVGRDTGPGVRGASTVSAHTGNTGFFHLGHKNVSKAVSTLVKQGPGPALNLVVEAGQPPLKVNSSGKVANLNSDRLDNLDSSAFLQTGQKATDSDNLDGKDSTEFYAAGSKVADSAHADNADKVDGFHANQIPGSIASIARFAGPSGSIAGGATDYVLWGQPRR